MDEFAEDFWALSRQRCGYYTWAGREPHKFWRLLGSQRHHPYWPDYELGAPWAVRDLFERGPMRHVLLDMVFRAVARAEARWSLRYVPQRSHEERLTGNLVSEFDGAVCLIRRRFLEAAREHYGHPHEVDFLYYDLSRGGRLEKETGADFGLIVTVDLPDLPKRTFYAAFQAKKLDGTSSLPLEQYDTVTRRFGNASFYLFYDMNVDTLLPPMVREAMSFKREAQEAKEEKQQSFSTTFANVCNGSPLSAWLFQELAMPESMRNAGSLQEAVDIFFRLGDSAPSISAGRLAILSLGKRLQLSIGQEHGLKVDV